MDQATLALIFSACSLLLSALAIGWNIVRHVLDGARISVVLKPGVLTHVGFLMTSEVSQWGSNVVPHSAMLGQGLWENVAVIGVSNHGRTATNVSGVGLQFRDRRLSRFTKKPTHFTPSSLKVGTSTDDRECPLRLEPGEEAIWVIAMSEPMAWSQDRFPLAKLRGSGSRREQTSSLVAAL